MIVPCYTCNTLRRLERLIYWEEMARAGMDEERYIHEVLETKQTRVNPLSTA